MQTEPIEIQGDPTEQEAAGPRALEPWRENLSVVLIGVGSVMLMIVIFRMLRRGSAARAGRALTPGSTPHAAQEPARPSSQRLERVMADAEELTRRLAAHLDNKAAHLDALLNEVDARTAELRDLLEQTRAPSAAAPIERAQAAAPVSLAADPMHARVYELADGGMAPVEIAREVDRPTGQIELILALRRA